MSSIDELAGRAGAAARRAAAPIAETLQRPSFEMTPEPPAEPSRVVRQRVIAALVGAGLAAAIVAAFVIVRHGDDNARVGPAPVSSIEPEVTPVPATLVAPTTTTAVPVVTSSMPASTDVSTTVVSTAPATPTSISPSIPPADDLDACVNQPVSPPVLPDGAAPTVEVADRPTDPTSVRWDGSTPTATVTQLLGTYWDGSYFATVGFGSQYAYNGSFEAAVLPVGDPPNGLITIDVARFGDGCVRHYSIGPGVELEEAVDFAHTWIDLLDAASPSQVVAIPALLRPPVPIIARRYTSSVPSTWKLGADGVTLAPVAVPGESDQVLDGVQFVLDNGDVVTQPDGPGFLTRCAGETPNLTFASDPDGGSHPLHPDLGPISSLAVSPNGIVVATRDVCPGGAAWGAVGTHWELVRLDLRDPAAVIEILESSEPDPAGVQATFPEGVISLGGSFVQSISDDGRYFSTYTPVNAEQGIHAIGGTEGPVPTACAGPADLISTPHFLDGGGVVVARRCGDRTLLEIVDLDAGAVVASTDIGDAFNRYSASLQVEVLEAGGEVWAIANWSDDVETPPEAVLVHNGQIAVLTRPGFGGFSFERSEAP